ncbi:MAG: BtrH N-terminal domain-containing protein, partial [Anaerolineae bacterium]|nr:BtrH N-terminal domain-containing protein [Anaerolineae bacterium]
MSVLNSFNQFDGLHWETGTIRNYFDYLGVKAPHTSQPYSEALLFGVSGGAVVGYFTFFYEGYDPIVAILTRNTFDPMDTIFERLGVNQNIRQTSKPEIGFRNLLDALENDSPAITWADMYSLPYNQSAQDEKMWAMMPILIYGVDQAAGKVFISDRSRKPLQISLEELAVARARVKKDKFRLMTPDPPNPDKLPSAVQLGIWDCIKLFTEAPPKGSKNNFGLAALKHWANLLVNSKHRRSWEKELPAGEKMYAGLVSAYERIKTFGHDSNAERETLADFLDEAAKILGNSSLPEIAKQFRRSAKAWEQLSLSLLPDEIASFGLTRQLLQKKHSLFLDQGIPAIEEIGSINQQLAEIKSQIARDF